MFDPDALRRRLTGVRDKVASAASRARRDPASVTLIAISKTFPPEAVRALADAGHVDFGENKVQEAFGKMDATSDLRLRWHLVGHLQSNKARKAAARFDAIHSIDSIDLLRKLDEAAAAAGRTLDCLVQADLTLEPTKHGATADTIPAIFEAGRDCHHARLRGLMLLPPAATDPEGARPHFRALRALRDDLVRQGIDQGALIHLSMGMSHDFEVAIEEGATLVRVGTAIFGSR